MAGQSYEIEAASAEEARASLKETYADPEAAGRFFDQMIEGRQAALERFAAELNKDEALKAQFARAPVELLHQRKLIGPLDQISIEGLRSPYNDFPWPWPFCRLWCEVECVTEIFWVCLGFWPIRFCYPVLRHEWRFVCRIICE